MKESGIIELLVKDCGIHSSEVSLQDSHYRSLIKIGVIADSGGGHVTVLDVALSNNFDEQVDFFPLNLWNCVISTSKGIEAHCREILNLEEFVKVLAVVFQDKFSHVSKSLIVRVGSKVSVEIAEV